MKSGRFRLDTPSRHRLRRAATSPSTNLAAVSNVVEVLQVVIQDILVKLGIARIDTAMLRSSQRTPIATIGESTYQNIAVALSPRGRNSSTQQPTMTIQQAAQLSLAIFHSRLNRREDLSDA